MEKFFERKKKSVIGPTTDLIIVNTFFPENECSLK